MAESEPSARPAGERGPGGDPLERIPAMQRLLDNPFLLLFIGVATPAVLYLIWGIMEIAQIPIAPPPGS
ncbi:MAG TPA: hypothetical protein VFZ01_09015 [Geminicoccaceae bacterium]